MLKKYLQRGYQSDTVLSIAIILFGLLFFVGYVYADTSSTSVTVANATPTLSVSFTPNLSTGGSTLTLSENTFVYATATVTVTDTNGCSTISSTTACFMFSSTSNAVDLQGGQCDSQYNAALIDAETEYFTTNCTATTTGNTCTGGADTSVEYDCVFRIWYPARPSDGSSPAGSAAMWVMTASSTDSANATGMATNSSETAEVATLNALDVSASVAYGTVSSGANTGATTQLVFSTSTGNTALDNQISGDYMCTDYPTCNGSASNFGPSQQKFDLTDQTYASLANTLAATSSPATIQTNLATSSATSSPALNTATSTYWGVAIPSGQANGSYTGQNTFTATADN